MRATGRLNKLIMIDTILVLRDSELIGKDRDGLLDWGICNLIDLA